MTAVRLSPHVLRRLAWVVFALSVALFAMSGLAEIADPARIEQSAWTVSNAVAQVALVVAFASFSVVGLLVVRRQPESTIGWLSLLIGLLWAATVSTEEYARFGLETHPGSLPAPILVAALGVWLWVPAVGLMGTFLILLFPDGRLPSPRWRPVAVLSAATIAVVSLVAMFEPTSLNNFAVPGLENPLAIAALNPVVEALMVTILVLPICMLACAVALIQRYRRSTGQERLQLKWLAAAGGFVAAFYLSNISVYVGSEIFGYELPEGTWTDVWTSLILASFGLVPAAIGIAVLRHRLYEIDVVISRALVVGALGVFITGVYVGIVVGIGALIGQQRPSVALSVVATAVVAVAFQPVRERVQRWVNRWVYGERATPYEVLADFASRVTGRYTTAELLPRLAETVSEGLGGARVKVWVRTGDELVREVSWPTEVDAAGPRRVADATELDLPGDRVIPVRHRDELLGALAVTKPAGEAITPPEEAMLGQVATQAGLVLRNLRLIDDLKGSRVRLVASQDVERRRLERNLHDGAQQSLVSVALLTRMAAARASDPELKKSLSDAGEQLQSAIDELRELARGIHPVVLTERGLGPALNSLAERSTVPVIVETDLRDRLPESIEATLYLVAAEAIRNAAQHADASRVQVSTTVEHGAVTVEITDDGAGGADDALGTGLRRLADRVAAVDGAIVVHSPQGAGTRITCRVPVAPAPPAAQAAVLEAVS